MIIASLRSNALCLAVAAALTATVAPAAAFATETVIIRDDDVEKVWPVTYGHAEVYDSNVINHQVADGTWGAVSVDRGNLRMERTQVLTTGDKMAAVAYYGGEYYNNGVVYDAVIESSDFVTQGDDASGLQFGGTTFDSSTGELNRVGMITVRDSSVATSGAQSHGMSVSGVNKVDFFGSQIQTSGQGAAGVHMMGGIVGMDSASVETTGEGAHGVHARSMRWSIGGRPGVVYRADLGLTNTTVNTHGAGSVGLLAGYEDNGTPDGIGATVRMERSLVRSAQSHAVQFLRGRENTLSLSAGSVLDGGDAVLFAGEANSFSQVDATDSTLIGRGAQALVADNGAGLQLRLDNSEVQVAAGQGLAQARNGGRIDIQARGAQLQGSAFADDTSRLDMQLDASRWDAWGQSQVDALGLHNGSTLLLGAGSVGDRFTVRGNLDITDSTLVFDSALGDDAAPADRLWVQGDTAGHGAIVVNNLGGRGGQTVDGIQLIHVDGVSAADFRLEGRAVGGQYEYFLFKGGSTDPDDGHWYLRSALQPVTDPCAADPAAPGCTITLPEPCQIDPSLPQCLPPVPVLRPEPGAYLANQRSARSMFGTGMQDRQRSGATGDGARGAWAAVSAGQARYGAVGDQLQVQGNTSALQLGTDLLGWGEGGRGRFGVMLGSGRASSTSTSRLTGYSAHGKVDGRAVGVYADWSQMPGGATGLIVGGALQHARFANRVQGDALATERYDSRGNSASVEAAYGFSVAGRGALAVFVQPQMQLRYGSYRADRHIERNGTVIDGSDADGLGSLVGVRVFGHTITRTGNRVQPFMAVNWIRESSDNRLRFDGQQLAGGLPQDRYEVKGGAQLQLGSRWSAWGDVGWQRGDGGYREVNAQLGMRASW
ncbi:autotransporter outer membrane beta-barrel domain-containing protein [Stenotrophomonas rhizophila]|uniref:autotransporter family protein n=1 Tax=Stenotrophomonas rhizophila TaxID=216778 RepID=UPI001E5ECA8F|nr:autotransporter outer membrane beta-barrel domain-containing protein [Stenotrophomonas rhizophila]MCC7635401.1 autotransporter outer membrane beta-barrel domain-containing protein [Stenotrophomonas rhizophila]MCC7664370.1 autotransporter outer membrane beta-barrel domain-containing protein [Stenotrophomonas rhizophila]